MSDFMRGMGGVGRGGVMVLAIALCTFVATPVAAQQQDTITLTLEDALEIALRSSPALRRATNQLELGGVEERAAWFGQVAPSIRLGVLSTGYNGNLQRRSTDFFGNPVANPISEWTYSSSTTQSVSLNWSIQGKSIFNTLDGLEVDQLNRELGLEGAQWSLNTQVRRQYYSVLQQAELLRASEADLLARQVDLDVTQRLFPLAQRGRIDLLNAEAAVEQQRINIQQQRRAYERSLLQLRTTLGDANLPPFRLEEVSPPVFDPAGLDVEALIDQAVQSHPDIRQAEASVRGAEVAVSRTKDAWWPQLNMSYQLGRSARTNEARAVLDLTHEPDDLNNSFSVSLSVPYFNNFFQNRSQEASAQVNLRNSRESLREAELLTEQAVRAQLIDLQNQFETLQIAERLLEIQEESLRLAREEFRRGTRSFQDLQVEIEAERNARRQVITNRYGFSDTFLSLEEGVGGFITIPPPIVEGGGGVVPSPGS